ncbi:MULTISPECIES: type A chloramphenicol O-acetyltransferase [Fusobacterium]|uniref:type A chloramphenicol O-acetyltransferase n=1 Tax=Fusobacterium TaxID=848 RepID=UPI0014775D70|nr:MULTISPECIES: type A chloramphenicol O-acetyltransferase [Fusobacterium]NME36754.1 type A chloramphenicol O-acetyltransferase [Fusobacterium sp. FSA-380-WT-3A]
MIFHKINLETWNRKEIFKLYSNDVPCTFSLTTDIDISSLIPKLKEKNIKFFPVILYALSYIVNCQKEFKMNLDKDSNIGFYDVVNPSYTFFHKDNESFSNLWTEFSENFEEFYKNYQKDVEIYGKNKSFIGKPQIENNLFNVSSIPWTTFTGFNLNLKNGYNYYPPIFTFGKYFTENNKILLPLAIQVHHGVCDGYHVAKFINSLQDFINNFNF